MENKFDLIVIGAGPAGYLGAQRAAQAGMNVCVFEKRALGGVCLNEGCIPSKALLNSAKVYEYAAHGEKYGVSAENVMLDHEKVLQRKNKVVKQLVTGIGMKMKQLGITVVNEEAVIDSKQGELFKVNAGSESYFAEKLLIATGSSAVVPSIEGLKESVENGFALTNREILDLEEIPEKLVVIGAGVIGLEMAAYFNSAGSKVTIIEMLDHIGSQTEAEISQTLFKNMKKSGITFKLGCAVKAVDAGTVTYEEKGAEQTIDAHKVLVAIGRRANADGVGLEKIGVKIEKGAVVTDEYQRTNVENVWAAGDINAKSMLAHTAYREAEVAVNVMSGSMDTMSYRAIPSVIYTNPEVACVGYTLSGAQEKGINAREIKVSMRMSGRYMAEVEGGNGICKVIIDDDTKTIVGVHMIGSYVSEMIYGAAAMIENKEKIEDIKKIVFPHPSVSEVIREALFE